MKATRRPGGGLRRSVSLLVAACWLAITSGCAGGPLLESTPTAATTSAVTALSTTQPAPTTTSTSAPPTTARSLPPWAGPGFPEALPPEQIPWDDVGAGWLLVRYLEGSAAGWDPDTPEALFLIDPENTTYAVAMWDGEEILDWSPEGRRILIFEGALKVIDLRDDTETAIPADLPTRGNSVIDARFTRPTGRDVVVRVLDWGDHVRLECLRTDGTRFSQLADFPFSSYAGSDPEYVEVGITWLYAPDGIEVVTATADGIRLLSNLGAVIRPLDTPGLGCTLSRWWDAGSVLAACYDRDWAASSCWYQGPTPGGRSLWSVPIDGSTATRLTPTPACTPGMTPFSATYEDALSVGGAVAARTGHCCGCGGSLDLFTGSSVIPWTGYPESPACSPGLIAVRDDRLLVEDTVYGWDPDHGATGWFGAIFEVDADGTTLQAITPVELGQSGGVLQVLTTEEATE
ncbi:MAG: hypothetical protein ABIJ48_05285 [Actinomycetota bacterium]